MKEVNIYIFNTIDLASFDKLRKVCVVAAQELGLAPNDFETPIAFEFRAEPTYDPTQEEYYIYRQPSMNDYYGRFIPKGPMREFSGIKYKRLRLAPSVNGEKSDWNDRRFPVIVAFGVDIPFLSENFEEA